jgi:hypothetical protein
VKSNGVRGTQQEECAMPAIGCQEAQEIVAEARKLVLRPWQLKPYSLVSWWDVEKFSAQAYFAIATDLERLRMKYRSPRIAGDAMFQKQIYTLSPEECQSASSVFNALAAHCSAIGLNTAAKIAAYTWDWLVSGEQAPTSAWMVQEIEKVQQVILVEMKNNLFLYLPIERAKWYLAPKEGWQEVIKQFPKTVIDIEEAGRCFACDRYAAAVFHGMQIAEVGAIEIGKLIEINDPKPGWPSTIREMKRIVQKEKYQDLKPVEQKHRALLEQLLPLMESMQDGWRHKISHVENKLVLLSGEFAPSVAEEILNATRAFMRRLATTL